MSDEVSVFDGSAGDISARKFAVAVSTYNKPITEKLLVGALDTLSKEGVGPANVSVYWVPGAWELALAAAKLVPDCDAVICLGAVIKGDTTHDQYINSMVSNELGKISVQFKKPIAFGVLTCNTVDQAVQRSGGKVGNKGEEAASAAISMLRLFDQPG